MVKLSCSYVPSRGKKTFQSLNKRFGYGTAYEVFTRAVGKQFVDTYREQLELDSEGVPTYDSLMKLPIVQRTIGTQKIIDSYQHEQPIRDNTLANVNDLVNHAYAFNEEKHGCIAIVDVLPNDSSKIRIEIVPPTKQNKEHAAYQYAVQKLNDRMSEILRGAGVSLDSLSTYETSLGRVGHTQFKRTQDTIDGFEAIIRIANNMEGNTALSEEFAHFVLGIYRNEPLVQRGINYCKDANQARTILGEHYDSVYEYYNGNVDLIAEEAAGHLFKEALIRRAQQQEIQQPLFQRLVDRILSFFRGINAAFFRDSLNSIMYDYSKFADSLLNGKVRITENDVQKAGRIADFNALSDKAQAQVDVLKKLTERAFKSAALQSNFTEREEGEKTERGKARQYAESLSARLKPYTKQEETMAAIAAFLTLAQDNIKTVHTAMMNIDGMSVQDKFALLRNALITIEQYAPDLEDIRKVLSEEYLSDEHIAAQKFVVEDRESVLDAYESHGVKTKDLSRKSPKDIAAAIVNDSEQIVLSDDETHYENTKTRQKSARVTQVIQADNRGEEFPTDSPWSLPATNIGTGMDELTRDFFAGKLQKRVSKKTGTYYLIDGKQLAEVYPNASSSQLNEYVLQLEELKKSFTEKGITIIPRDVTVDGEIVTIDGRGIEHTTSVAGTLDLLGYDKEGNWYIYDLKTHRSNTIDENKKDKYRRQLTLYKQFLEEKYGIQVKEIAAIPIKVSYPTPVGAAHGTATFKTSSESKSESYSGKRNNQLIVNGEEFKELYPKLEEPIILEPISMDIEYAKLAKDPTNGLGGGTQFVIQAVSDTYRLYQNFIDDFAKVALPEFVEFLKPFVGETIKMESTDPEKQGKFVEVPIKQMVEKCVHGDTTLLQRWLSSMADNPDGMLQIFDKIYKIQMDKKRLKTIEIAQKIFALGIKYEKRGIKSYDWMFESDKMNYLNEDYDLSAYNKARKEFNEYLDNKYGKKIVVGSKEHKDRLAEEKAWRDSNTKEDRSGYTSVFYPDPEKYPSKYSKLSATQKEFYQEWMEIKRELDDVIGQDKTTLTNSIKIRKSYIERLGSVLDGTAVESFVEGVKSISRKSFDDDINYKTKQGIRNFDGSEFMKLPLYYIHADEDQAKDISTDVIGTLIAYADMAYNYEAMNEVVNPLEIGRELLRKREITSDRRETFFFAGKIVDNPVSVNTEESNMWALLNDFFESKIYGRYLKDYGNISKTNIDTNKAASALLKLGSTVQLGFNLLANLANTLTGNAMQNIEAAAGEHFDRRTLMKADGEFITEMGSYIGDIGQRRAKSKLELFDQMFDVRQNFSSKIKNTQFLNRSLLLRIFGPGIQYIGQDAGDHWLYNRTAIAIALRYKMYDTKARNEVSLWDALTVVPIDKDNPDAGNKLVVRDGVVKENGEPLTDRDISDISGKMRYVNQHLFGIYNQEDAVAARRTILGRFAMQYRDFIPTQARYRFGVATSNLEKGGVVEGYYRTTWRFAKQLYKDLQNGEMNFKQSVGDLEDWEVANLRRARREVLQFLALWALCKFLSSSDPKDRPWLVRLLRYMAYREYTELGMWVPGPTMFTEGVKILRSPFAASNILNDLADTTGLLGLLWPPNYWTEVESGDYKGHSKAYKAFVKSPLSLWWKTLRRNAHPEKAEQYYK